MRNALAHAAKGQKQTAAAIIRTAFAQETAEAAKKRWRDVADQVRKPYPKLAVMLGKLEADVLAFMDSPKQLRQKLHSTNPLERLNKEIKRRTNVVGICPNEAAAERLIGAVLPEQNDEWSIASRYMPLEALGKLAQANGMGVAALPPAAK